MTDSKKTIIIAAIMVISLLGAGIFYDKAGCTQPLMGDDVKETPTPTPTATAPVFQKTVTKTIIVYEGNTTIKDALAAKTVPESTVLKEETAKALKDVKYPFTLKPGDTAKTEIIVQKYRWDEGLQAFGYWITATRGDSKQEVQVNSPIWLQYSPYEVTIAESVVQINTTYKEKTVTIKEDVKTAVDRQLIEYVNRQPLGKATVGTKE